MGRTISDRPGDTIERLRIFTSGSSDSETNEPIVSMIVVYGKCDQVVKRVAYIRMGYTLFQTGLIGKMKKLAKYETSPT